MRRSALMGSPPGLEIFAYAMKLLATRDLTVAQLHAKLEAKFGEAPQEVIDQLIRKRFLDDRRYAENYTVKRLHRGPLILREELLSRGVDESIVEPILNSREWPSLEQALADRIQRWRLKPPISTKDATRLFKSLCSLGFEEDAVRAELERLHEQ